MAAGQRRVAAPVRARRARRTLRTLRSEAPFIVVGLIVAGGVGYLNWVPTHWLRGVITMGTGFLLAGVLRLTLPSRSVGMLAVRGRVFDTFCYVTLGVLVITFAVLAPASAVTRV